MLPSQICVYVVTVILNAILTNNAAVAVVFPIVDAACKSLDLDFIPFLLILMMAGSADFSTPIGYQCNLMVYGPGGYKFVDYIVFGLPLQVLTGVVTIGISAAPEYWYIWAAVLAIANVVAYVVGEGVGGLAARFGRKQDKVVLDRDVENGGSTDTLTVDEVRV